MELVRIGRLDHKLLKEGEPYRNNFFTIYTNKKGEIITELVEKRFVKASVSSVSVVYVNDGTVQYPEKPIRVYDYAGVKWIRNEDLIFALGFK
jgi:hypothetical protein